jgi:hypothetical protein
MITALTQISKLSLLAQNQRMYTTTTQDLELTILQIPNKLKNQAGLMLLDLKKEL